MRRRTVIRQQQRAIRKTPLLARVRAAKAAVASASFARQFKTTCAFEAEPTTLEDARALVLKTMRAMGVDVDGVHVTLAWEPASAARPNGELKIWCRPDVAAVEKLIAGKAAA